MEGGKTISKDFFFQGPESCQMEETSGISFITSLIFQAFAGCLNHQNPPVYADTHTHEITFSHKEYQTDEAFSSLIQDSVGVQKLPASARQQEDSEVL